MRLLLLRRKVLLVFDMNGRRADSFSEHAPSRLGRWRFKYLLSGSATEKLDRRGLFARDSGAVFSNTTVVKVVGGQCTTSTCNGKTPGYTFYAVRLFFSCARAQSSLMHTKRLTQVVRCRRFAGLLRL